jgi:hypothetical protein
MGKTAAQAELRSWLVGRSSPLAFASVDTSRKALLELFLLTVPFCVLGAVMAWLISYDELTRHYAESRTPAVEATRRALTALIFLFVLGALLALILSRHH